ncbi:MAG: hypothetical protein SVS15_00150 [Thermodesulfobacteriota bacterium]|nr:hypothetical protein [Thermodesulfobacteriota bacterium]
MSAKLALMHNMAHYSAFKDGAHHAESVVVVTPDLLLADHLDRAGLPFLETWDFLTGRDIDQAQRLSKEMSRSWWRPCFSGLFHAGVDLGDAIQRDMWFFFIEAILSKFILERIFERFSPREVYLFPEKPEPKFWEVSGDAPHVFHAVARRLCDEKGIRRTELAAGLPGNWAPGTKNAPPPAGPLPPWPYDRRSPSGSKNVLLYFTEVDYRKHANFLSALNRSPRFNCHLLRNTNYEAPEFKNQGIIWGNVIDWFKVPDALETEINDRGQAFEDSAHPLAREFGWIFANPHMDFQFKGVVGNLKRAARIAAAADLLMKALNPGLSISGIDTFGQGFIWNRVAKNHGVPTLAFPHGSVGSRFYLYEKLHSEAGHIALEGEYAKRMFKELGRRPECMDVVGAGFSVNAGNMEKVQRHGTKVLLMTTIAAPNLASPMASSAVLRRQWSEIIEEIGKRPDVEFEIKPHPRYDYYDFYQRFTAHGPDNVRLSPESSLEQALNGSSAAVLVGPPSTAVLLAMLAKIPTIHLNGSEYRARGLQTCLPQSGIIQVGTAGEMFEALDRIFADESFRRNTLQRVDEFLPDLARPGSPEEVLKRTIALAERLAGSAEGQYDAEAMEELERIWMLRHFMDAGDRERIRRELDAVRERHADAADSIFVRSALDMIRAPF